MVDPSVIARLRLGDPLLVYTAAWRQSVMRDVRWVIELPQDYDINRETVWRATVLGTCWLKYLNGVRKAHIQDSHIAKTLQAGRYLHVTTSLHIVRPRVPQPPPDPEDED